MTKFMKCLVLVLSVFVSYNTYAIDVKIKKTYYDTGELKHVIPYVDGKLQGVLKTYNKNRVLIIETPYVNGKLEGVGRNYYKTGELQNESHYVNGIKEGIEQRYFKSGDLGAEIKYENGEAVSGFLYGQDGSKKKMTNAHLHNYTQ